MAKSKKIFSIFNGSHNYVLSQWGEVYEDALNIRRRFISQKGRMLSAKMVDRKTLLVHTLRNTVLKAGSVLLNEPAANAMAGWDIISTSVIDANSHSRTHWGDVGFILAVPPQNIIGTFERDVSFPNHIGNKPNEPKNSLLLVEQYLKGINKSGNIIPEQTYASLKSPEKILDTTKRGWNEILVVGKSNINIYKGLRPTTAVEVVGIYVHNSTGKKGCRENNKLNEALSQKLSQLNGYLPIFVESTHVGPSSMLL